MQVSETSLLILSWPLIRKAISVPISGLVVTFCSQVDQHSDAIDRLRTIPEIEIGSAGGSKLAIVVDSETKHRDQEIWNLVRESPGVIDLAVALVAFDEDSEAEPANQSGIKDNG